MKIGNKYMQRFQWRLGKNRELEKSEWEGGSARLWEAIMETVKLCQELFDGKRYDNLCWKTVFDALESGGEEATIGVSCKDMWICKWSTEKDKRRSIRTPDGILMEKRQHLIDWLNQVTEETMGDHVSGHNSVELGWPAPATGDQSENEVEVKEDIEVGGRYRVWWPSEEKWYTGTVTSKYGKKGHKWRMKYDDGDKQIEEFRKPWCISLKEEQHEAGETEEQHKKRKQQTRKQEDAAAQETATDFNETCEDLFGNSE